MGRWANENAFEAVYAAAAQYAPSPFPSRQFIALLKAITGAESGFNPGAYHYDANVNDASRGLMQIEGATATAYGITETGDDTMHTGGLYDPVVNVPIGAQLIAANLMTAQGHGYGLDAAISAYNAGFSTVRPGDGKRNADGTFINQAYVDRVKSYFAYFLAQSLPGDAGPTSQGGGFTSPQALGAVIAIGLTLFLWWLRER